MQVNQTLFHETQRFRQIWIWILILIIALDMWYEFIQQIIFGKTVGSNPAPDVVTIVFWALFGIIFPVFMLGLLKLRTKVYSDGIYIRFFPLHLRYRKFLFKDIQHYESISYSPIKRFGGWGIRFNTDGETAYNVIGKKGIELKLKHETVVIGTQKPEEFKRVLDSLIS
ncbi:MULTISPECIES: DUF6141 family protein [Oceanobacillus]|uniref:DUF6141 family protein n=1 Tax=Oceanobacillus TaxID=182709 RepID=UPI00084E4840|nr:MULTISPECIES: DUF6141 family protein [Oceanobacillus]MBT2599925.1 hypothetical protein [Oceanobacillus sp. ISL-74]MBT2652625.1 hypothetical protein [Oceanobacillus sp. ISL-73]OEH56505.1 hypothetical protein AQ616_03010 [Oceanobacillus sp. E9]